MATRICPALPPAVLVAGGVLIGLSVAALIATVGLAANNEGIRVKQFLLHCKKTCVAFVGIFVAQILARIADNSQPLPALGDLQGWFVLIGGCVGGAAAVWLARNKLTPEQIAHGFVDLPEHEQRQVVAKIGPGPYA